MAEKVSANFYRHEFACKCGECGMDAVDVMLIKVLEKARRHFNGSSITITSGNRCERHNASVGGSPGSQHIYSKAADFQVRGVPARRVADYLESQYPTKFGIGRYKNWTHLDVRTVSARWGRN